MALTIIKSTVNFQSYDVAAPGCQLFLLHPADFIFRKKDVHLCAFHAVEACCHCASRIARRGNHHFDVFVFLMGKTCQQPCHKASAHIFKSKCRAVKKLETKNIILYFNP